MKTLLGAVLGGLLFGAALAYALGEPCPSQGDAHNAPTMAANEFKNRSGDIMPVDPKITLASILEPGNDETRFSNDKTASVTGYIALVKPGGVESCNCHASDPDHIDTHIALVNSPNDFGHSRRYVIVEVTPHTRGLPGTDFDTLKSWLHRQVKVTGWIFFDTQHKFDAENTNPGGSTNWRATCVEIHPVTKVELL